MNLIVFRLSVARTLILIMLSQVSRGFLFRTHVIDSINMIAFHKVARSRSDIEIEWANIYH